MISTRELAKLAGVSQSTISRSLNDHPGISSETKERVLKIARDNGYVERTTKRKKILSREKKAIGIMTCNQPFFDDLFINYTLNLLTTAIESKNYYSLHMVDYSSQNHGVEKLRELIRTNILEGLIILTREYDEGIEEYLNSVALPHVYLLHYSRKMVQSVNIVDSDNYTGGYLGTKYLLEHGHQNIITLTAPWREFEDRTQGYKQALSEHGLSVNPNYILEANCTYKEGFNSIIHNCQLLDKCTALYAQSDILALGAANALQSLHLSIPNDFSVIGSDGYPLGTMCQPPLDSIAHPIKELVWMAVNRLIEIERTPKWQTPRQITLSPYIIKRGSVKSLSTE